MKERYGPQMDPLPSPGDLRQKVLDQTQVELAEFKLEGLAPPLHHEVPFFSQNDPAFGEAGEVACGLACLKMLLDASGRKIKWGELYNREVLSGGRTPKMGWDHGFLAGYMTTHGIPMEPVAYAGSIESLYMDLQRGPLILSIYHDAQNKRGGHLVIVTGFEEGFWTMLDPASGPLRVSSQDLARLWKRRAIVPQRPPAHEYSKLGPMP